jgi:membrane protein insertase Oxa1/YidC/SpoIIIJ
MGLSLPVAMAIYWFITSLISLLQTYIMQVLINKDDKKKHVKYKTKR